MFRLPWLKRRSPPTAAGPLAVVLQATGSHAWAVSGGWAAAARELGVLGAVLAPRAAWGAKEVEDDGGLREYLARAGPGDVILLMGFDWHSQVLHQSRRWRARWERTGATKILYVHESLDAARRIGLDRMGQTFLSAAELADAILFSDLADRSLVESTGKPSLWQPFGVDLGRFRATTLFSERTPRAFFRGKVDPLLTDDDYAVRRRLVERLRSEDLLDVIPYAPGPVDPDRLADDFNRYQIAVNLPSVFAGHPTRVLEGMACGCCVVTNRTGIPEVDALFRDGVDVLYYRDEAELVAAVRRAQGDGETARAIAERGQRTVAERFSLRRLLAEVLAWVERLSRSGGPA